jgi:hypothetical protein
MCYQSVRSKECRFGTQFLSISSAVHLFICRPIFLSLNWPKYIGKELATLAVSLSVAVVGRGP